jgi:hypothetical protein
MGFIFSYDQIPFKLSLLATSFMHNLNSLGVCDLRGLLKDVEGFFTRVLQKKRRKEPFSIFNSQTNFCTTSKDIIY